jgi:predicted nucleotidyltransferase component of viral defense system
MASSGSLTAAQRRILAATFAREQGFFLTGGAALVGYHLHHRTTDDLDLFTLDEAAFERGPYVIAAVAAAEGGKLEVRQDAPGFRRYAIEIEGETVVVDLVLERVRQAYEDKPVHDGIAVDPPEEIVANKLCAIVGRLEERDLVDVMALERAGYRVEDALAHALAKDGGCTPANLAWLLSEIRIPSDARLPGGVAGRELSDFVADLVVRLRRAALPRA